MGPGSNLVSGFGWALCREHGLGTGMARRKRAGRSWSGPPAKAGRTWLGESGLGSVSAACDRLQPEAPLLGGRLVASPPSPPTVHAAEGDVHAAVGHRDKAAEGKARALRIPRERLRRQRLAATLVEALGDAEEGRLRLRAVCTASMAQPCTPCGQPPPRPTTNSNHRRKMPSPGPMYINLGQCARPPTQLPTSICCGVAISPTTMRLRSTFLATCQSG